MKELNEAALISFGNYLLSKEREDSFRSNPSFPDGQLLKERLSVVHDSDLKNWFEYSITKK